MILAILAATALVSCDEHSARYDAGISRELAEWRKSSIEGLKYNIDIDLVKNIGRVDIDLELSSTIAR